MASSTRPSAARRGIASFSTQTAIEAAPQSASASWKNGMKRTSMMPSEGPAAVSAAPTSAA